jgi:S1-C subfamily serine protease
MVVLLLPLLIAWPQAALALTASQVYEQVKDSVVVVKAYDQRGQQVAFGSGVMLPSGDIITNYHLVKTGVRYKVRKHIDSAQLSELSNAELEKIANTPPSEDNDFTDATTTPAKLKTVDSDKDLCLLTAAVLAAKPARLGKAAKLKVGEPVYAVGAPQGLELSLSEGIVSQLRGGPPPLIQTTVAISQGSSGGGLFNAQGELVGITTFYLKDGQNLNFALPVEWIDQVARGKIRELHPGEGPTAALRGAIPKEGLSDRGRPAKARFTKDKNGVISDNATGLEWYTGPDQDTNWKQAKSWSESLTVAGGGWRMPTIPELQTLYQPGAGRNNIDPLFQTTENWIWSGQMGETSSFGSQSAGFFGFSYGKWAFVGLNAAVDGRAFAVRSKK